MAKSPVRNPSPVEKPLSPSAANFETAQVPVSETPGQPFGPAGKISPAAGAMLVDGYVLEEKLGRGGFGEVWRALGPGGFRVAMKFIRLEGRAGHLEKRSLELMRQIQHPNLLALFGAWERHETLIIAMELGRCTLLQRLEEALDQGWLGIPPSELLEYMREAAKGIDYLNEPIHKMGDSPAQGIQHRDIKPQNLLLVGTGVKVADFGLVKLLEQSVMEVSGSMTPAYAAPEQFNGQASRWSDQYSLAVTYCHLRGNALPFSGTAAQIIAGHVAKEPKLTMLPEAERPVVARALAKEPSQRFPHCKAFVEALAEAIQTSVKKKPAAAEPPAPRPAEPAVQFKAVEEEYHRFHCPKCRQMLRVKTTQLNRRIRCSTCKTLIQADLPVPPAPVVKLSGPIPRIPQPPEESVPPRHLLGRLFWSTCSLLCSFLLVTTSLALTLLVLWGVFFWWCNGTWPGKM